MSLPNERTTIINSTKANGKKAYLFFLFPAELTAGVTSFGPVPLRRRIQRAALR